MGPSGDGTLTADEVTIAKRMYGGTHRDWDDLASEQRYTGAKYGSEADWSPLFADNGGYGPFIGHYVYSLLTPPYRLAARHQLGQRLRLREGGADAGHRGAEPGHPAVHRPRRQADPDGRLERLGRAAGRLGRLLLSADAVGADAEPAEPGGRQRDREADAAEVRPTPTRSASRCGSTTACSCCRPPAMRRKHRPELNRRRHARAAEGAIATPTTSRQRVIKWVEQGVAPEKIVATKFELPGALMRSRPVCAYPDEAAYNGSGDDQRRGELLLQDAEA